MSIECEFRSNGVILWHAGVVTGEDLLEVNLKLYAHKYPDELKFQLMDLTKVEAFDVSPKIMSRLAKMDKDTVREHKQFACVVAPTDLLFGLSRSWNIQSEASDFENNVVRRMDQAIAWFQSKGIVI